MSLCENMLGHSHIVSVDLAHAVLETGGSTVGTGRLPP